jgi:trehalose 6-phosphate phosphatase
MSTAADDVGDPPLDEPRALAVDVTRLPRPLLLALDVDGVLAPIVGHAEDAELNAGVHGALDRLAAADGIHLAVVSGRSLASLDRFGFPEGVTVVGSHGVELDGTPPPLDARERRLLAELVRLAEQMAEQAGPGAWVEHKPASVVLHVREADPARGHAALEQLRVAAGRHDGAGVKAGSAVTELLVRHGDKGRAIDELRRRWSPASTVFVGDDVTDEDGFQVLGPRDVGIKVGPGGTAAGRRLADPDAVRDWLDEVLARL